MGKRKKIWSGFGRAVLLCAGLGFVLAGCAVQKSETGSRKPELAEVKIPNLEDFTTIGKPTKIIETPNGPVEVYDPAQDLEVRAAFKRLYDKYDPQMFLRDKNDSDRLRQLTGRKDAWSKKDMVVDVSILFRALEKRRDQFLELKCPRFIETEGGRWWNYDKDKGEHGEYIKVDSLMRPSLSGLGNKSYPSRDEHPIGPYYFTNALSSDAYYELNLDRRLQPTSADEQFRNFFTANCDWQFPR